MPFRLLPAAEADLGAIAQYIADDDPEAARRWFNAILESCRRLGDMPGLGVARPEVRADLRTLVVGNYLILYREISGGAEIVRVIHGARQWQDLL